MESEGGRDRLFVARAVGGRNRGGRETEPLAMYLPVAFCSWLCRQHREPDPRLARVRHLVPVPPGRHLSGGGSHYAHGLPVSAFPAHA